MLELKNISVQATENGNKEILKDVSLTIGDGKLCVITGPNGSGKSTLAKVIAGIMTPEKGQIFFDGQEITHLSITERAKLGVSFAFQQPVRFKGISVRDLLLLAAGKKLSDMELCGYLKNVGLCAMDYLNREVNASLSGGEIKRIEIAMVLARKTRLTLFDEPEAGIDLWSFNNLIDVFEELRREIHKSSIIVISHQERILGIADELIVLSNGSILRQGPRSEILPTLGHEAKGCAFCTK